MPTSSKYRPDIQGIRGIAVLAVVLFHAYESYFSLGFLGVDIFFVISGFVVTPLILRIFEVKERGQKVFNNLSNFYKRRFFRLAPALSAILLFSALVIALLGPIADHQRFARQGIATILVLGNIGAYRYSGDYFSSNPNPLVHTWSLSVEEQIYIFLPIAMVFLNLIILVTRKIATLTLLAITAISFFLFLNPIFMQSIYSNISSNYAETLFSFYSPFERVWQFTLGGLCFLIQNPKTERSQSYQKIKILSIILLLTILFGQFALDSKIASIAASLISASVILLRSFNSLPGFVSAGLSWVGDRSYSIYLVHMPLVYIAKYSPIAEIGGGGGRIIQSSAAAVVSILLGSIFYKKVENRFRELGYDGRVGLKHWFIALIVVIAIPMSSFIAVEKGFNNGYWGLNKNLQSPTAAWELDKKCERMADRNEPCLYLETGARKTILLIGDSHAAHLSQAVIDVSRGLSWNTAVWTKASCLVQFQKIGSFQISDSCLRQNQKILDWVKLNRPDTIIVSEYVRFDSSQLKLRDALASLYAITPQIILVENNPIFPDEKEFMEQRPLAMSPYRPPKSFKQSELDIKDKAASNNLASWARKNGIKTLNLESVFCKAEKCIRYSNGVWLYRNVDHLSVEGAKLAMPKLKASLSDF